MNERLLIDGVHSKAAVLLSARSCPSAMRPLLPLRREGPFLQSGRSRVRRQMAGLGGFRTFLPVHDLVLESRKGEVNGSDGGCGHRRASRWALVGMTEGAGHTLPDFAAYTLDGCPRRLLNITREPCGYYSPPAPVWSEVFIKKHIPDQFIS
jgi:hypothetical protein